MTYYWVGMWIDVRLTEQRLQIQTSDIKAQKRWLNSTPRHVVQVSLQGDRIVLRRHTHTHTSCVCSNESSEIEHSIHSAEASWKLKVHPTACAVSHLNATCVGERHGKCHTQLVGVFLPAQATHILHCVSASSHRTAD